MAKVLIPGMDLNTVAAWDGESRSIPPGDYVFQIEGAEITQAKSSGNSQLKLDLSVVQGFDTDTVNGVTWSHYISLSEKSAGRVRCFLDAVVLAPDADGGFDTDDLVGRQFVATAYEDTYSKTDMATGQTTEKTTTRLNKERPVDGAPETAPAAPAAATKAPAAAPKAAPAPAPAAAGVRPVVRPQPQLPKPGTRVPQR